MPNQKHIVMTVFGSLGDLHPMMALALALQARGHRVTIATNTVYREKIEQEGIGFSLLGPDFEESQQVIDELFDRRRGPEILMKKYLLPGVRQSYEDLRPLLEGADCLINSPIVYAGPVIAEALKLPWAAVTLQPYIFFSAYDPPVLTPLPISEAWHGWSPLFWKLFLKLVKSTTHSWPQPVYALQKELGVPSRGNPIFEGQFSPYLNLALFSKQVAAAQPDWPPHTRPSGFVFYDRMKLTEGPVLPAEIQQFLAAGPPPEVFTLGSSVVKASNHKFYEASLGAAEALGCRAIFLAGDKAPPGPLSEDMLWWDAVPYSALFPHAAAIVHQGGMGTTAQAMRAGKPMLIVPHGFDQPDNAARLKRLGVSKTLYPEHYTVERVVQALTPLLNQPEYTQRAQLLGENIRAEDGLKTACDQIEMLF